jgi:hypothetical protein
MTTTNAPRRPIIASTSYGIVRSCGLGHCACGYPFQTLEVLPEDGSQCLICPRCHRDTNRQVKLAAFFSGPFQSNNAVVADLKRSATRIFVKLKPPPDEEPECWFDIYDRLLMMRDVEHPVGDPDQRQTHKDRADKYVAGFEGLQIASRGIIADGVRPLVALNAADTWVEIVKRNAAWTPGSLFRRQVALKEAWELLQNWGQPVKRSVDSTWHCVAEDLLGEVWNLTRQMGNFLEALKTSGTAGSALTKWP